MHHYALLSLFVLFIGKHFIVDYVLQYPYMIEQKGTYGAIGGLHHSALHGFGTFIIMLFFVGPFNSMLASLIDAVTHYHIDYFKQNITKHYTTNDRMFWIALGLDQALHYITYAFILGVFVV